MYHRIDASDTSLSLLDAMIDDIDKFLQVTPVAETTRNVYAHFLIQFGEWAVSRGYDPADITAVEVAAWIGQHPEWTTSTKHNASAAIRQFYRWRYGDEHPATRFKVRRVMPPPQRTLTAEELTQLLDSIDRNSVVGARNYAIVCFAADTGARASEIATLELKNLNVEKRTAYVLAKGGEWALKVFSPKTAEALTDWLIKRSTLNTNSKTVFVSVGGHTPGRPMTRYGMHSLFERLSAKAGLEHISPHALRRTFATLAIENGAPTRLVQVAGGWSSVAMVERYTRTLKPDKIVLYSPVEGVMPDKT